MATLFLFFSLFICFVQPLPFFFRGRPRGGMLPPPPSNGKVPPEAQYIEQKLDHFNHADTRTWKQRYWINSDFYSGPGPVFLMIGGEGRANPIWMVEGQWLEYARQYQAVCFMVEHRYYGDSHPTPDMSNENLQHLSSEQALADLAYFQQWATGEYRLTYGPRWILFGGSYPGSLAAWGRLKYPHLFHAAVSSSAPLTAVFDFKQFIDVVVTSLETQSKQGRLCTAAIDQGTRAVTKLIKTKQGRDQLKTIFSLCDDLVSENDISNFFSTLAGNFEGVVQYNGDNRAFEGAVGTNVTIETLCDIMGNVTIPTEIQRLAAVNHLVMKTYGQSCVDVQYKKMIEELKQTDWNSSASEGGRQWTYQTCTEFGFFQSADTEKPQPFGGQFDVYFFLNQCTDIFGSMFTEDFLRTEIRATNTNYGSYSLNLTNIVYVNGLVDPWHALGFTEGPQAIFINGTAHCANMYPGSPKDPPQLVMARKSISKLLSQWVIE